MPYPLLLVGASQWVALAEDWREEDGWSGDGQSLIPLQVALVQPCPCTEHHCLSQGGLPLTGLSFWVPATTSPPCFLGPGMLTESLLLDSGAMCHGSPSSLWLLFIYSFYWSIVDLQCCVFLLYSKVAQLYILYIYVKCMYIFFFHIPFHSGFSQGIGHSFLCYTVGPCCLSILYIVVCIC